MTTHNHIPLSTPVKASVYLFTPALAHIESSGTQCAVTPLTLDGQIPGEMEECGLDTTLEHSAGRSNGCALDSQSHFGSEKKS